MIVDTYTFDDVLIQPHAISTVMSRSNVDTSYTLYQNLEFKLPVISASMSLFDTEENSRDIYYQFAAKMSELGGLHIFSRATLFSDRVKAVEALSSIGVQSGIAVSLDEFSTYYDILIDLPSSSVVSIDIANGSIIKNVLWEKLYDDSPTLIVGNFGNPQAVIRRDLDGSIAFKLGVGSGAGCTTRVATGVGAPQGWLIREASRISRKPLISDGGVKTTADFSKAVALGADLVMMGRIFAAAKETPWPEVKLSDGKWYKRYNGMASVVEKNTNSHIEGDSGYIPYEGKSLEEIFKELKDGLTSAMSYSDSHSLDEFKIKAYFLRVTESTVQENVSRLIHPA